MANEIYNLPSVLRPRDLEERGFPQSRLRSLLKSGEAERVARGLYRLTSAPSTEFDTIAMVCKQAPRAVVCLLTALQVHGLGTQSPRDIWIALDRKARKPLLRGLPVRVVRFSGPMLRYGILEREIQGVPVRITSPARTVVDSFRYRRKIGLDAALEALREGLSMKLVTVDDLMRTAEVCRAASVIRPYLESLSA